VNHNGDLATDRKWKKMQQLSLKDKIHRLLFKPKNRVRVLVVAEGPTKKLIRISYLPSLITNLHIPTSPV